jgi:hypothetical protein
VGRCVCAALAGDRGGGDAFDKQFTATALRVLLLMPASRANRSVHAPRITFMHCTPEVDPQRATARHAAAARTCALSMGASLSSSSGTSTSSSASRAAPRIRCASAAGACAVSSRSRASTTAARSASSCGGGRGGGGRRQRRRRRRRACECHGQYARRQWRKGASGKSARAQAYCSCDSRQELYSCLYLRERGCRFTASRSP